MSRYVIGYFVTFGIITLMFSTRTSEPGVVLFLTFAGAAMIGGAVTVALKKEQP
jgi:hypothetical protein